MSQVRSIVQINTRDQRGGAERVAWNLYRRRADSGARAMKILPTPAHNHY